MNNRVSAATSPVSLSKTEFDTLLACLPDTARTQRDVAARSGLATGTVNKVIRQLRANGLVDGFTLTPSALTALEPHRVDNAIIMAAGMSSRFAPVSYERPKGMLRVRGEVLIEREIRQLHEAGITDIVVVVGYRQEQFLYLEDALGVTIVVNPDYITRNNNSSIKAVEDRLGNTYVCSSDNYFTRNVFEPYVYRGYYSAVYAAGPSPEWGLTTTASGRIVAAAPECSDTWVMMGHAYWDRVFSAEFRRILDAEYDLPETAPKLWEAIYADHLDTLDLRIRRYEPGIIYEFDSLDDLRAFDPDWMDALESGVLNNICRTLDCQRADLSNFTPITTGLTNLSFKFTANGADYVYRHPGEATVGLLNRQAEAEAEAVAAELGLDDTFLYLDPETGWKISRFFVTEGPFDYHNARHVELALPLIRTLHTSGHVVDNRFDLMDESIRMKERLRNSPGGRNLDFPDFAKLEAITNRLYALCQADGVPPVLCHNDFYDTNILVNGDKAALIDWEYTGMGDYASDIGVFICCSDYTPDEARDVIASYFEGHPTPAQTRHCVAYVALASYYWWLWALYKDACGEPVGDYLLLWYRYAKEYGATALAMYAED